MGKLNCQKKDMVGGRTRKKGKNPTSFFFFLKKKILSSMKREAYVDLHWVGRVPVDVAQPVGGRGRLADQLNQQQQEVDDHFGRHFFFPSPFVVHWIFSSSFEFQ